MAPLFIILFGRSYDCTDLDHPGGRRILEVHSTMDCSDVWTALHTSADARCMLKSVPSTPVKSLSDEDGDDDALSRDYRRHVRRLRYLGLTDYQPLYGWQAPCLLACACALAIHRGYVVAAAILLGFVWQQLAFMAHDAAHAHGQHPLLYFALEAALGVHIRWWKATHNRHHALTNHLDHDPDVQYLPLFLLDAAQRNGIDSTYHQRHIAFSSLAKKLTKWQHVLFLPIMGLARFNLYAQSALFLAQNPCLPAAVPFLLFFVWYGLLLAHLGSMPAALIFTLVSHVISGILHVQITLSHFPRPVVSHQQQHPTGFIRNQFASTLDIDVPAYLDWFHGGLQFQTTHHLFPRLSRAHLRQVQQDIVDPLLCAKHGIARHHASFGEALHMLWVHLREHSKINYKIV